MFPTYPKTKESGLAWLGKVPSHWDVVPLKRASEIQFSNVDKHSVEGQKEVRLCNYVDVYKNDRIGANLPFMVATASGDQIRRLGLFAGDVIITKDSETPDDIGVPAFVPENLPGVVCGYHLALLRVYPSVADGGFLTWAIRSRFVAAQFTVAAEGITRFALGKSDVGDALIPAPPCEEQHTIAFFLDHKTALIDDLIAKRERQIELLQEHRLALISRAVTKGLNPDVPMKDSGVEWLGEVPEHWETKPLGRVVKLVGGGTPSKDNPEYWQGNFPWVSPKDMKVGVIHDTEDKISPQAIRDSATKIVPTGAVLIVVRSGILNHSIPVAIAGIDVTLNQDLKALITGNEVVPRYLASIIRGLQQTFLMEWRKEGATVESLEINLVMKTLIPLPTIREQLAIVAFLENKAAKIDAFIVRVRQSIEKLREYRQSLISAAVTGKINVSERVVAPEVNVAVSETKWTAPPAFRRAVLVAEIVHQLHPEPTFGRVKLQKTLHMAEYHIGADIDGNYYRQAAGPLDPKMLRSVEGQMERQKWFRAQTGDKGTRYVPLENAGGHRKYFDRYWSANKERLNVLINLLRSKNTEFCEIVDTLFAAWNDLIIAGTSFDDGSIIKEFLENWHDSKKRFGEDRLRETLRWMRENGLVPTGRGKPTIMRA